ncbi:hypothetical protein RW115_11985 [Macrococcus capreoli]
MAKTVIVPKRIRIIEEEKKISKNTTVSTTYLQIAPIKRIVNMESVGYPNETAYMLSNDTFAQVYKYKSYDLNLLNHHEKGYLVDAYIQFLRLFQEDIKNISLMFPVDTYQQQLYWEKKYQTAANDIQRTLASNELRRLKAIEKVYKTQSHYIFLYAPNLKELTDKMKLIEQYHTLFETKPLSLKDKKHLNYRLNNQDNE